ncbi:MAG: aminopeptidase [Anaerolineae bacterium]|nr:aminopeptidase [Anaerolineae bacterium]
MIDPRVTKLADILVNYSTEVKEGDWVLIQGNLVAEPLINEIAKFVLRAGGHTSIQWGSDMLRHTIITESSAEQIAWFSPDKQILYDQIDVFIMIDATTNTRALAGISSEKFAEFQMARRSIMETGMRRSAAGELRVMGTRYPCAAFAQDAGMSLQELEDFMYSATFADRDDPVQAWNTMKAEQQRWVDWLQGKNQVVVRSKQADLSLSIAGRNFINDAGKQNMPSGEIFTSPVEDSANGWVQFSYPAIVAGREVEQVRLEFKDGRVVNASAAKNEDFLLTMLDMDEGARVLGEFAIGTNYGITRFTKSILYDEKIGGSFHMALGAGFPEAGSLNKSALHWDFICDARQDTEILVDGELLYKDGKFQV